MFAMTHARHLTACFGFTGAGCVLQTVKPRLFDDQLEYIVNHAKDRVLLYDAAFQPVVDRMKPRWPTIEHYICFASDAQAPAFEDRSEEHTSELQSLMRTSYAVFCLKKKISKQFRATHT